MVCYIGGRKEEGGEVADRHSSERKRREREWG